MRLSEVTNRGYQQIESSSQDAHNREQALNYWGEVCNKVLNALKGFIEKYCERKLYSVESNTVQQIQIGSSNFRTEIEGYLNNAESTFGRLSENLRIMLNQVTNKLQANDARSEKLEGLLIELMGQNKITQEVLENERKDRGKENKENSNRIAIICNNIEKKQNFLATDQQAFKGELMKDVAMKVECGFSSEMENENKNEPPGLSLGGDDRGLGRKVDPSIDINENKETKEK